MSEFWGGPDPKKCGLCNAGLKHLFVDGRTVWRSWTVMCCKCLDDVGVGLGVGKGQLYMRIAGKPDGKSRWKKVEG